MVEDAVSSWLEAATTPLTTSPMARSKSSARLCMVARRSRSARWRSASAACVLRRASASAPTRIWSTAREMSPISSLRCAPAISARDFPRASRRKASARLAMGEEMPLAMKAMANTASAPTARVAMICMVTSLLPRSARSPASLRASAITTERGSVMITDQAVPVRPSVTGANTFRRSFAESTLIWLRPSRRIFASCCAKSSTASKRPPMADALPLAATTRPSLVTMETAPLPS